MFIFLNFFKDLLFGFLNFLYVLFLYSLKVFLIIFHDFRVIIIILPNIINSQFNNLYIIYFMILVFKGRFRTNFNLPLHSLSFIIK